MTFQAFGKYAQRIPRFFLCILCTIICTSLSLPRESHSPRPSLLTLCPADIVLAEAGYTSFEHAFDTLLVLLSYWLAIYTCILLEEHFIFRGASFANYNLARYNDRANLPVGLAAAFALCCGIAGAVVGMSQTCVAFLSGVHVTRSTNRSC